ncbi:MAG: hypothetical protein WKG07_45980 [Hymenobacter sp.]
MAERFAAALRSFDDAAAYPPHQAWIGNAPPRDLPARPWVGPRRAARPAHRPRSARSCPRTSSSACWPRSTSSTCSPCRRSRPSRPPAALAGHPLAKALDLDRIEQAAGDVEAAPARAQGPAAPRATGAGRCACAQADDESLSAHVLIDNLAAKATATLALLHLLEANGIDPDLDRLRARLRRGGHRRPLPAGRGNLAKAVAEAAGLTEASGADVKNFCAAPVPALVMASALVASGRLRAGGRGGRRARWPSWA